MLERSAACGAAARGEHSMDSPDLKAPQHYINRELSFLEFNQRVLEQAFDESVPLLERLRFLCIACSNLDEFFEIRVAGLKQLQELGGQLAPDGMSIPEQLAAIHDRATRLVADQYRCLNSLLLPALAAEGVPLLGPGEWTPRQTLWLEDYFEREVEPVLSPLGLDPARPFPRIQNKSLNFIVRLEGKDAFDRDSELAIVQAPRSLPRVVPLPGEGAQRACVLLSSIVQAFVHKLFTGIKVIGCYQFRVTRNSDLFVDEEEIDDLRRALEGELAQRRYGAAVRLETSSDCPQDMVMFLQGQFASNGLDTYPVAGPVNLNRLSAVYELVQRPDLKYPIFTPGTPKRLVGATDLFACIRHKDVRRHPPLLPSRHRQLPPAHRAALHRLRPVHLRRRDRPGRARGVSAAHQPHPDPEAQPSHAIPVRHARDGVEQARARSRARARRTSGAHHRQDECAGGPAGHRSPLPRLVRRGEDRSDRARRVLPASGRAGRVGEYLRALHRRSVPRALPGVLFRERRRAGHDLRQRRLDGAQLLPPRGSGLPRPPRAPRRAHPARPRFLSPGQLPGLEAAARRALRAHQPRRRASRQRAVGAAGGVCRRADRGDLAITLPERVPRWARARARAPAH